MSGPSRRMLGGRFTGGPSPAMERYSSSLRVDLRMLDEDVEASIAHATMLGETGIVSKEEAEALCRGLEDVRTDIADGSWVPDDALEDVHMAVETRLTELVGDVGKKLHTARSRNDQVATDVRLWLRRRLREIEVALEGLIGTLVDRAEQDGEILLPGATHLQRGQPILLGHHLLAHAWPLQRDRDRIAQARERLDACPLGAGAMAGTPHPIDRRRSAALLDFPEIVPNAMDAVAARDHEQEVVCACAIAMTHLSRMGEELVLWSTSEYRFVRLGEAHSTGSSIMPQKRNPDAAELIRGRAARVQGAVPTLLAMTKNLPLAYNRDLQESREVLFDAVDSTRDSIRLATEVWRDLEFRADRFEEELVGDFSLATELADLLVERGVPFREAHEIVGAMVRWCEDEGGDLNLVLGPDAPEFHPAFPEDLSPWLDPRAAAERRESEGGTASAEVRRQIRLLRNELEG